MTKEKKYNKVKIILNRKFKDKKDYNEAISILKELDDYNDAKELLEFCEKKLKERNINVILYTIDAVLIVIFAILIINIPGMVKEMKYQEAVSLYNDGNYIESAVKFGKLGDYKDSNKRYFDNYIKVAKDYINNKEYEKAIDILMPIRNEGEASSLITKTYYDYGMYLYENKDYVKAIEYLTKAEDYVDSSDLVLDARLEYVKSHKDKNDSVLLSYLSYLKYSKYKEEYKKIYREVFGWTGKIELLDIYSNPISNKKLPKEYKLRLTVEGGKPNESHYFSWYKYGKNYKLERTGTSCNLRDGGKCTTGTKYDSPQNGYYGFAVYYGDPEKDGYLVADIKFSR